MLSTAKQEIAANAKETDKELSDVMILEIIMIFNLIDEI